MVGDTPLKSGLFLKHYNTKMSGRYSNSAKYDKLLTPFIIPNLIKEMHDPVY